jgi:hypothetical protein
LRATHTGSVVACVSPDARDDARRMLAILCDVAAVYPSSETYRGRDAAAEALRTIEWLRALIYRRFGGELPIRARAASETLLRLVTRARVAIVTCAYPHVARFDTSSSSFDVYAYVANANGGPWPYGAT